jgi:hypothetical protein
MITFSLYLYMIFSLSSLDVGRRRWRIGGGGSLSFDTSVGCESPPRVHHHHHPLSLCLCYIVPLALRFCCALIALYRTDDTYIFFCVTFYFFIFFSLYILSLPLFLFFSFFRDRCDIEGGVGG